ncbi:MAG TPA: AsmA family protein [Burkholderiaceae bacterium]|nr:AsmA family protein [Burkholderiaceae bacterium]HNB45304.1 AsmA family protein [Burkholderiaceae bacterium]HNG80490.1 AsmA family protein [Burkholderiaceae bacterium]
MSAPLRKALIALAVLLGLAVATLIALIATFDANRYKGVAVDWMREHYQRELAVGDVQLGVFPRLAVSLRDVALSEHGQPQQRAASLASAHLAVQWWPLLRRQLVVDEVKASGLTLRYRRDAEGRSNLDDLLKPAATPASDPAKANAPLHFDVQSLQIEQVQLDLDDRRAQLRGQATLTSLKTGRLGADSPAAVSLNAELKFSQPALAATLQGSAQLRLNLGEGEQPALTVQAQEMALQLMGDLPGLSGAQIRLGGSLSAGGDALEASALMVDVSGRAGALRLQDARLALKRLALRPAREQIELEQLALKVKAALVAERPGQGAAEQPLDFALDWPKLAVQGQTLQGAALSGQFSLQGPAALQGQLSSGPPSGRFDAILVPALTLKLGAATQGADASRVQGTLRSDLTLRPRDAQATLAKLAVDAQVQNPALRALAISAQGEVEASPQRSRWQLAGTTNGQAFATDGQIELGGARPRLQAQARFGELDLDALLPPRAAAGASAPAAHAASAPSGGGTPADRPIDLAALRSLDARFSLLAGTLRYAPYVLRDVNAQATLEAGRLQVAPLRLRAWDGTIDARLGADAGAKPAQQRLTLQATASDIQIQALLKDVAQQEPLEGRGRLQLDLQTGGASMRAMEQALAGSATLQLHDGAVRGINLAQRLREAKALLSLRKDASSQAQRSEKTDFSELAATFQIQHGVAENRDLALKSPFLRVVGEGRVDVPARQLDYTVRSTLIGSAKGQGGAEVAALKGVTVPVRLNGPFDAPGWHIRWSEVAIGAAGTTVKQQLQQKLEAQAAERLGLKASDAASAPLREQARDKAREAVKDRLKGLLNR